MLTLEEVKSYLKIDYEDEDNLLGRLIITADEYLKSSVGKAYDNTSERAKTLSLIIIGDLYGNRGLTEKPSNNTRKLIEDFTFQMRVELGAGSIV